MGAVPEAIAVETVEKLAGGGGDVDGAPVEVDVGQQPIAVEEVPSLIDNSDGGSEDHDHPAKSSSSSNEEKVGGLASKAPVLGGASPSEASSEWPEQAAPAAATGVKSILTFALVRVPRAVSDRGDLKSAVADQVKSKVERRDEIKAKFQEKLKERKDVGDKARELRETLTKIKNEIRVKKELSKNLSESRRSVKGSSTDSSLFSSEEALDNKIAELERRLQQLDGPITIQEEKKIIRELKLLRDSREQVVIKETCIASTQETRENLTAQLKVLHAEIDALITKRDSVIAKLKPYDDDTASLTQEIDALAMERRKIDAEIDAVYAESKKLSSQEQAKNSDFFQNRSDINAAKQLAHDGQCAALQEFSSAQVERLMNLWNTDDEFRAAYIKNNLESTIKRLGTPDGRSRGPNEKPFKLPTPAPPAAAPPPPAPAPVVEEKPQIKKPAEAVKDEPAKAKKPEASTTTADREPVVVEAAEEKVDEAAAAALLEQERERRREVELEKAREAEARKKKQAEKKQAKAQARLEKEQLRKEKEKEKKLRKKASNTEAAAAAEGADATPEQERESSEPTENGGEKAPSPPEEKKKQPTAAVAPRRGKKQQGKSQVNPAVKQLQLKRKRSIQRQLYDHWQIIAAVGVALLLIAGAAMVFVGRA